MVRPRASQSDNQTFAGLRASARPSPIISQTSGVRVQPNIRTWRGAGHEICAIYRLQGFDFHRWVSAGKLPLATSGALAPDPDLPNGGTGWIVLKKAG
jgi:hypothetical protein